MNEQTLRDLVTYAPLPSYPAESVKKGNQGVVVASVRLNSDGIVQRVTVVEAPDQPIADSVTHALSQWRFKELFSEEVRKALADRTINPAIRTLPIDSRLTFYFQLRNNDAPIVKNPADIEGWIPSAELATRFTADTDRTNFLGQPIPER